MIQQFRVFRFYQAAVSMAIERRDIPSVRDEMPAHRGARIMQTRLMLFAFFVVGSTVENVDRVAAQAYPTRPITMVYSALM